ncbi:MAG: FxsA family protein [Pseudomonadota bacterium]
MLPLLIFLIIAMPIIEIFLLIQGAMAFGILTVIGLTIGTAALGSYLIKRQGISALNELRATMNDGRVPVAPAVDGAALLIAAPLLMTPGFVTDGFGFLLLVPGIRREAARWALRKIQNAQRDGKVFIIRK